MVSVRLPDLLGRARSGRQVRRLRGDERGHEAVDRADRDPIDQQQHDGADQQDGSPADEPAERPVQFHLRLSDVIARGPAGGPPADSPVPMRRLASPPTPPTGATTRRLN